MWNAAEVIDFEAPAARRTHLLEATAGMGIICNTADAEEGSRPA